MFPADLNSASKEAQLSQLKEIIARTLEKKGVLSKLKAELRKHVFDALEEQENVQERQDGNGRFVLETYQDRVAFEIVREYLSFHQLDYTLSMLETEAEMKEEQMSRSKLATNLRLGAQRPDPQQCVLDQIVKHNYVQDVFSAHRKKSPPRKLVLQERLSVDNTTKSPSKQSNSGMNMLTDRETFLSGIQESSSSLRPRSKSPPPELGGFSTNRSKFGTSGLSSKSSSGSPSAANMKKNDLSPSPPKFSSGMSNLSDLPPLNAGRPLELSSIGSKQQGDKLLEALDDILDSDEDVDGALGGVSTVSTQLGKSLPATNIRTFAEMKTTDDDQNESDDEYDDDDEFGSVEESDGIAEEDSDSDGSNPYAIDESPTSKDEMAVSGDLEKRSDVIVDLV